MKHLAALLMLAGCADLPLPEPPPPPPPPPPIVSAPATSPPVVTRLAQQYHAAALTEGPKVLARGTSPDYVRRVHDADTAARNALRTLDQQGRKIRPATLQRARDAVHELLAALNDAEAGAAQ